MSPKRPVLRYHGGKWRLAPWIIQHLPPHRIYVEPFGGAGSVLLRKTRSFAEVWNDLDEEVVNVFRVLRNAEQASALIGQLELTPWSRQEFFACYESMAGLDPVERARRTVTRSFMAFGTTSARENRTGFRSKAYRNNQTGPQDWTNYPSQVALFVDRLRGVNIEHQPALKVIQQQDSADTLFYCDPPYPLETRTSVQWDSKNDRAYRHDMFAEDHRLLANVLRQAKGMVVLSSYRSELYDELFAGWKKVERAALADGAKPRLEVLWFNPAAHAALRA